MCVQRDQADHVHPKEGPEGWLWRPHGAGMTVTQGTLGSGDMCLPDDGVFWPGVSREEH